MSSTDADRARPTLPAASTPPIVGFIHTVLDPGAPRRLAELTLEVVMRLLHSERAAVFSLQDGGLVLFASQGIDQGALDAVHRAWEARRESLESGETLCGPDPAGESAVATAGDGGGAYAVAPILECGQLVGVLFADSVLPSLPLQEVQSLQNFVPILARALTDPAADGRVPTLEAWNTYLERTPVEELQRAKLLLMLERNEWNIARVARLMGVTRRTIYLRLERYRITRQGNTQPRTPRESPQGGPRA